MGIAISLLFVIYLILFSIPKFVYYFSSTFEQHNYFSAYSWKLCLNPYLDTVEIILWTLCTVFTTQELFKETAMQSWTTKKPDRPGYWWGLTPEGDTTVVLIFPVHCENEDHLFVDCDDDLVPLTSSLFNGWGWGSNKITEPMGEKI